MSALDSHIAALSVLERDPAALDGPLRVELIGRVQAVRNWIDAREAELLAVIHAERDDVNAGARDVSQLCQQQANVGFGEAKRRELRSTWIRELPALGDALASGVLGTVQVDELCLLAERLPAPHRPALRERLDELIVEIAPLTPVRVRKRLSSFEADFDDDDGESRLERQRRSNRLRMPKRPDGAVGLSGQLDPVSAEYVRAAVDAKVAEMWRRERSGRAELDPPDRVMTSDERRAAALVELVRAGAAASPGTAGRAEIIVHIDYQTLLGELSLHGLVKLGSGATIPAAEARQLACGAEILPVVLGGPSQPLDVGRVSRLATSAQRAALRAVHDTCCIAGCDVPFDYCEIHHIDWWRLGGRTDLDNLVPVCSKHHHLIHDHAWQLTVDEQRVCRLVKRGADPAPTSGDSRARRRTRSRPPSGVRQRSRSGGARRGSSPVSTTPAGHTTPMRC